MYGRANNRINNKLETSYYNLLARASLEYSTICLYLNNSCGNANAKTTQ
jgi:hypothetical protein